MQMQNIQNGAKQLNDLAQFLRDRYGQQVNQLFTGSGARVRQTCVHCFRYLIMSVAPSVHASDRIHYSE